MSLPGVESLVKYYFLAGATVPKLDVAISCKMPSAARCQCRGVRVFSLVRIFSINEQHFSLTINQRTILSIVTF
jgi:hypothetical protein